MTMEASCNYYTDPYGYRVCLEFFHPEYAVFQSEPRLEVDIKHLGLAPRRTGYYEYKLAFSIDGDRLIWETLGGEFAVPLLHRWPKIDGVSPVRPMDRVPRYGSNPRMWEYTIHRTMDYTGELLVGKEFLTRFWPRDEKATPVPFRPDVFRFVHRLRFERGVLVEDKLVAENQ